MGFSGGVNSRNCVCVLSVVVLTTLGIVLVRLFHLALYLSHLSCLCRALFCIVSIHILIPCTPSSSSPYLSLSPSLTPIHLSDTDEALALETKIRTDDVSTLTTHLATEIADRTRNIARVDDEAGAERAERLEAQKVAEEQRVKTNAEVNMKFQEIIAEEVCASYQLFVSRSLYRHMIFRCRFHLLSTRSRCASYLLFY